jgi:metal-sulfur cluster biosynthetic enzyme
MRDDAGVEALVARIRERLGSVLDPEIGLDVVSLGLVYEVRVREGEVEVDLTMTSPACPLAALVVGDVEAAAAEVSEGRRVTVTLVWSPPWTAERLSPQARELLGWEQPS